MKKVINIDKTDNYRMIIISDIHGHVKHLKKLIQRLEIRDEDYLIILGDFINKGPDSLGAYKYVKQLSERKNTYILKGNNESFINRYAWNPELVQDFYEYLNRKYFRTIVDDFIELAGRAIGDFKNGMELLNFLDERYREYYEFIEGLPIILNIDDYTIVHGGYNEEFDVEKDEVKFLKYDFYNDLSKVNKNTIIVGHWPVSNLRDDIHTNTPHHNDNKNIIFIDGGLGLKDSGELNAFIIEKKAGKVRYETVQENDFVIKTINEKHDFKIEKKIFVNYPHYEFEIISEGKEMTRCKHIHSQKEFTVFNEFITKNDKGYKLSTNYINKFFNLDKGTDVEVCKEYKDCVLIKYDDEFGWIKKYQIG